MKRVSDFRFMQRFSTDWLKRGNEERFCLCDPGSLLGWLQSEFPVVILCKDFSSHPTWQTNTCLIWNCFIAHLPLYMIDFPLAAFSNSRLAFHNFSVVSQGFNQHTTHKTVPAAFLNELYFTKNWWSPSLNVILPLSPQKGLETTTFFLRLHYSEKTKQICSAKHWHEWNPKPSGWRWKILERENRTGELCFNPITSRSSWLC